MTDDLLEQLLNEDESPSLDFKREQYLINGASNDDRSELLKDILAFANSWRRTDAYILVGVEDVKGGRSRVVGVKEHLDDAKLQQFVNSKTQRPVTFSYAAYPFEGAQLGILRIALQDRPVFLKRDFGRLGRHVVYIRRGSSTDQADPDEVARMGASAVLAVRTGPILDLQFADIEDREELGCHVTVKSILLKPRLDPQTLASEAKTNPWGLPQIPIAVFAHHPGYHDDLVKYVAASAFLYPVAFVLENKSSEVALGVELRATTSIQEGVWLVDETDAPVRPVRDILSPLVQQAMLRNAIPARANSNLVKYRNHWEVAVDFGTVLPRSKVWSADRIYVGGNNSQTVHFEASLYAENLSDPVRVPLSVRIDTERRPMERGDLDP